MVITSIHLHTCDIYIFVVLECMSNWMCQEHIVAMWHTTHRIITRNILRIFIFQQLWTFFCCPISCFRVDDTSSTHRPRHTRIWFLLGALWQCDHRCFFFWPALLTVHYALLFWFIGESHNAVSHAFLFCSVFVLVSLPLVFFFFIHAARFFYAGKTILALNLLFYGTKMGTCDRSSHSSSFQQYECNVMWSFFFVACFGDIDIKIPPRNWDVVLCNIGWNYFRLVGFSYCRTQWSDHPEGTFFAVATATVRCAMCVLLLLCCGVNVWFMACGLATTWEYIFSTYTIIMKLDILRRYKNYKLHISRRETMNGRRTKIWKFIMEIFYRKPTFSLAAINLGDKL